MLDKLQIFIKDYLSSLKMDGKDPMQELLEVSNKLVLIRKTTLKDVISKYI